jgi:predicted ATPase/transcriptional regulator with XRE-family HTH domain
LGAAIAPKIDLKCATISSDTPKVSLIAVQPKHKMEEYNAPVSFYEWLKRRRKALDMTQDELAKRAACSVGTLRKIESGVRRPSKQLAGLLAKALKIPDQEQETFIRVARSELNPERLSKPAPDSLPPLPQAWTLNRAAQSSSGIPVTKPTSPANHIPLPATPLIGRETELAALERIFIDPQCRLLTLTGAGGMGKTRLALEFAARTAVAFPGGVFYIPLASVGSPQKIVPTIADHLDFAFSGPANPKEQLIHYLSNTIRQDALFIFDNLEHLLAQISTQVAQTGVVELISEILQRLSNVKILGTSRERLNIQGEWTFELHGLSVPPTSYVGQLEDYSAFELFMKSAQRIRVDFQELIDDRPAIIQICQIVEGVPLAIELAAAWVCLLSCQEIAKEIQSNMDILTTSLRNIPERHRSIRATFDHSWKLLSDEERRVLCQLAVFHGGFDRQAALQIAGAPLALLASLSDKSLVRRAESGRYDLHEVIRQYAMAHLDELPDNRETYERHCEYYLSRLQASEQALKSAAQQTAVRQLTDEIDNIRAAWSWAIDQGLYCKLGMAGRAFGWFFEIAGIYREGIEQFERIVQALKAGPQNDPCRRVLGLALIHQALLYFRTGEFEHALSLYEESILILRPLGDPILLADALIFSGIILHLSGEFERASSALEEGLALARANHLPWFEAYAIDNLGYIASLMGCYEEGLEQMLAGIAIWRTLGDQHYIALGLNFMVPTLIQLGRFEEAKTCMQESIALCELSKNRWGMGTAYRFLGLANLADGQYQVAQAHLRKSLEIFGQDFVGWDIARSRTYLGDALLLAGDRIAARDEYLDALRVAVETNSIPIALDALSGLGSLEAQTGSPKRALELSTVIINHPSSPVETKNRVEQLRLDLETKYSREQVQTWRMSAAEKTLAEIVKETL